jgi:hypothetical protein
MDVTVQSVFGSSIAARPIVRALRETVGEMGHVSLISLHQQEEGHPQAQGGKVVGYQMGYQFIGVVGGMAVGGLGAMLIPSAPNQSNWIFLLVGAIAGGMVGFFTGGLVLAAVMGGEAKQTTEAIEQGDVVVRVTVDQEKADYVCRILTEAGGHRTDGKAGAERSDEAALDREVA